MLQSILDYFRNLRKNLIIRKKRKALTAFSNAKADLENFVAHAGQEIEERSARVVEIRENLAVIITRKHNEIQEEHQSIDEVYEEKEKAKEVISELEKFTI